MDQNDLTQGEVITTARSPPSSFHHIQSNILVLGSHQTYPPPSLAEDGETPQAHKRHRESGDFKEAEEVSHLPSQAQQEYIITNNPDPRHRHTRLRRIPLSNGQRMRPLTPPPPPPPMDFSHALSVLPAPTASTLDPGVWPPMSAPTRPPGTWIMCTLADFCPCNIQGHACQQYTRCQFLAGKLCTVYVGPVPFSLPPQK